MNIIVVVVHGMYENNAQLTKTEHFSQLKNKEGAGVSGGLLNKKRASSKKQSVSC